jgi:hypothetical protein
MVPKKNHAPQLFKLFLHLRLWTCRLRRCFQTVMFRLLQVSWLEPAVRGSRKKVFYGPFALLNTRGGKRSFGAIGIEVRCRDETSVQVCRIPRFR